MLTDTVHATLTLGSTGDEVMQLQFWLNGFYGPSLQTDGYFGPETESFVRRFQTNCTIPVDGIVGARTWAYLEEIIPYARTVHSFLRRGETGSEVKYLQARLNHYFGPELTVDGCFDAATEAQVKRFQAAVLITVDGVVGLQTWLYVDQPNIDI